MSYKDKKMVVREGFEPPKRYLDRFTVCTL